MRSKAFYAAVAFLLAFAWAGRLVAAVEVTVDRNPVQVNETFQLVFSLDRSPDRDPDFSSLEQHFEILQVNPSSMISIINGEYSRSVRYTLRLMPKQVGEFVIPAIRFDQERSEPFQVTVKPASLGSVPQDELMLEVLADREEAYVQGQIILSLRLLRSVNISDYQFGDISIENVDAVIEPLGRPREFQTNIANKTYMVLEKRYALFPQQSGRLQINPVLAEVRLRSRLSFDPFRGSGEIRRLRSQPLTIDVEPIPTDFRGPYWLPASKIELRETWQGDPDAMVAGEPVTRGLSIVADGLTAAQLPALTLQDVNGIKQYEDQPTLENGRSSDGIRGRRSQKVAVIPGAEGVYRLPPIELPWWNLETGRVEVATLPARDLIVLAPVTPPAPVESESTAAIPTPAAAPTVAAVNPFWLWLSLFLACGWASTLLYWWVSRRRASPAPSVHAENPSLRQAHRRLRQACETADAAAARQALLDWGRALLRPREVANLHQLGAELGGAMAAQIDLLNTSLYARSASAWSGDELLRLCRQLEQRQPAREPRASGLQPLNPTT